MDNKNTPHAVKPDLMARLDDFASLLAQQGAVEPETLLLTHENAFADALVVVGATSRRHAQGLADGLGKLCRDKNYEFLGMEGYELADWILVDCNDIVVNIFQEEPRKLYRLEELWKGKKPSSRKDA